MTKTNINSGLKQLYFISFIEGGVVMVTEITGAKLLTPYFGASLYSWASTLSITLFALMLGYYVGGYTTTKPKLSSIDKIIWVFFTSGLAVLLMPTIGNFIMQKTLSLSFFAGLIISQLIFLFIPIFLMGMISPMIIYQITKKVELSGRSTGNIYALSTCGGIIFTLTFGFLIIPNFGISIPLKLLGLFVALIGFIFLIKKKITNKKISLALLLSFIVIMAFYKNIFKKNSQMLGSQLISYSEGLLGELKVVDELSYTSDGRPFDIRKLKVNNVQQNFVILNLPTQSLLYYVNFTKQLIKFLPKKNSALLIGLGAGSLYTILKNQNIPVESVEIDKRIYDIGVKYFAMPAHSDNNTITDGRYFINTTKKKYDLIILDVIIGENVPSQLITVESFRNIDKLLNINGTLIIEHGGVNNFSNNSFVPSIVKTLYAAGFQVSIFNPVASKNNGDIMLVATKNKFDVNNINLVDDYLIKGAPLANYQLSINTFNNISATIFTDDINRSDILLKSHYLQVRKSLRKELLKITSLHKN